MSLGTGGMLRALCASFILCGAVVEAADYYVSTSGSNSNSGLSGSPWRTLQYAADEVGAGDRVFVLPGNYTGFNLTTSGAAGLAPCRSRVAWCLLGSLG